ncbi:MAG: class I SAM-dependent methyltransferase [Candidatus Eremiobacteraeota bacterium]|nr:class I SAM-dependent methyltransferase [Candidatus Eremiobacteraeota bacterium]MCW5872715.1 class I SAM-dependent methyltransferase [Candidatus Eremiobacteraeota bacterium]
MSLLRALLRPLRIPETVGLDLDNPSTTLVHRRLIRSKPFLEAIYVDWYRSLARLDGGLSGPRLEIGSGGGFLPEVIPGTLTSDVLPLPYLDYQISGEKLPFDSSSLAAIYMVNTLHHVPEPASLLREAERCLMPGGRLVCLEPAPTLFGRFVYRWLHHEPCDLTAGRSLERSDGPLSHSNSALPWILFVRDAETFQAEFPGLRRVELFFHTPFRYLLSGGVSFRCLLPAASYRLVRALEEALQPFSAWLGMFMTTVVERQGLRAHTS